ncbi:nitroreductase [Sulfurimicrobium lacus]|uniref:Nitroreductase n=1 Tax=Sulfurimicrobium lacus TaxID=2715678 RepID=A0A6F8VFX9_9PROT|nr:nitroreductase family protein [Sulfurimicrobium lacus]BCB27629.1 nitroreductase [Sulfurimicrobium lacus]
MQHKPAITAVPVHEIITKRWSCRAFDAAKPVSRDQIVALMEAARWAPSCFGDEPWHFIVWDKDTDAAAWNKAFDCLGEWNQNWVKNAPLLILVTANSVFHKNGKPNAWGQYDSGAAAENMCLQAVAMGLMAHQMGGFDPDKARKAFGIPEQFSCMAMIAVGYQGEETVLDEELKALEVACRARSAIGEHFFEGTWGKAIKTG